MFCDKNQKRKSSFSKHFVGSNTNFGNNLIFSRAYCTDFLIIKNILYTYLPILKKDTKLHSILESSRKKGKTLGNLLSPSEFIKTKTWLFQPGFFPCGDRRCNICKYTRKRKNYESFNSNKKYAIRQFINCSTTFVVYCIVCTKCNLTYVDCTKRKLKVQIAEHPSDIRHKPNGVSGAAKHFIEHHETSPVSFSLYGIERVSNPSRGGNWVHKLFAQEVFWILHLNTCYPTGLNYRTNLMYFY